MEKENSAPSLRSKAWSALCYGSLAGFVATLPVAGAIFFKNSKVWNAVNEWTASAMSFASLAGGVYGWNKRETEYLEEKAETLQAENAVLKSELGARKSWVARETNRCSERSSNIRY